MDLMYRPIDRYRYEIQEQGEVQVWYTGMHRLISSTFPLKIKAEGFFASSRSPEYLITSRINDMTVKDRNDVKLFAVACYEYGFQGGRSVRRRGLSW
jgi:predicted secreted protein